MNNIKYTIQSISDLIGKKHVLFSPNTTIKTLLFDSRKLAETKYSLFFVLPGKVDGHKFIEDLYKNGIRNFVISDNKFPVANFPEANFIYCHNTLLALQNLASQHRKLFNFPVIGITGSNGKTVVKEWLFQLLHTDYKIVRSPKSFNSQLGVALSVWEMDVIHNLGIFEAGISQPGEMDKLQKIIQPTIAILTNIGQAHDEGFIHPGQKLDEKLALFSIANFAIINQCYAKNIINKLTNFFTWSFTLPADLKIISAQSEKNKTTIQAIYKNKQVHICIPFTDKASIENAIICWATLLFLGVRQAKITFRMQYLQAVKMRLELKSGKNNCTIIDDTYNSDLSSLEIALDFLNQQQQHPTKTLILSDLLQTGKSAAILYEKVTQLLATKNINKFIGVGNNLSQCKHLFATNSHFYIHTDDLIADLGNLKFNNEAILIKGARKFGFQKISKLLTQKVHETVLEVNLNALENNFNYFKSLLNPNVKVMAVVKAFSYGSGSYQIANVLQYNKVDYLAVAFADEGTELRAASISTPIMVMSPEVEGFDAMVSNNLEPELYSFRILKAFAEYILLNNIATYPIHIKLDTGMHRLGFEGDSEINELALYLKNNPQLKVYSVFSHFVASEDAKHDEFTLQQIKIFTQHTKTIEKVLGYKFLKHIANTAAIGRFAAAQFDMVRLGIGFYGVDSTSRNNDRLENVLTLKTNISQIKYLHKGDTVGYGRKGVMPNDGKIATLKIGYADGVSRKLGNGNGKMWINNKIAYTIGSISMDMCMLDITDIEAKEGDEVTVFGDRESIYNLAEDLETIPYEILTSISQRVKRIYYYA